MVSVCLPSDALSQHLPSYLGFSYLGHGVSLHGCSSTAQPLLLTLDEGDLLTTALPDLQCEIASLGSPAPAQPRLLGLGVFLHGCSSKSQLLLLTLDEGYLLTTDLPDLQRGIAPLGPPVPTQPRLLGRGVGPLCRHPWPRAWGYGVAPPGHRP